MRVRVEHREAKVERARLNAPAKRSAAPSVDRKERGLVGQALAIQNGARPFAGASAAILDRALERISAKIEQPSRKKTTRRQALNRSAAATVLLSLANASKGSTLERALGEYVAAMSRETCWPLKVSMLANLINVAKLTNEVPKKSAARFEAVKHEILPPAPPYEKWFGANPHAPKLRVRHYVMSDFWRANLAAYRRRGFEIEEVSKDRAIARKDLTDDAGKAPPVHATVDLVKGEENIFGDLDDPKIGMVLYSGHSMLGGVNANSLHVAPSHMVGGKVVGLFSCRGKQTGGEILARFKGVHLIDTDSSAYDDDDQAMLTELYRTIGARGTYADLRKRIEGYALDGGPKNYILPDDPRSLAQRDDDHDGRFDATPLGRDLFYDPQSRSAEKVSKVIAYANTAFYYFADESKHAPLGLKEHDRLIADGWFDSESHDLLRIRPVDREGERYYQVAINSKYADRSKDMLIALSLSELHRFLAVEQQHKYAKNDALRTVMLVGEYADQYLTYAEDCDRLVKGWAKTAGFVGVSWDTIWKAMQKDTADRIGTEAALATLVRQGVKVPRT